MADQVEKLLVRGVVPSQIALLGRLRAVLHPEAQELAGRNAATTLVGSGNYYQAVLDVLWLADRFEELREYGLGIEPGASGRRATLSADVQAQMRERLGHDELDGAKAVDQQTRSTDDEQDQSADQPALAPPP